MVYDQAQSPRLGQRTPIESTYIQSFDFDPDTDDPPVPEAAWPGQLINYRYPDGTCQLLIWDEEAGAWSAISGGIGISGGAHIYVGSTKPTGGTYQLGDLWYDDDDNYSAHVWDGSDWVDTQISATNVTGGTLGSDGQDILLNKRLVSKLGLAGQHVTIGDAGLYVYKGSNEATDATTIFDTTGQSVFRGQAEISNLTTTDSATFRTAVQLSRQTTATMNNGVTPPGTAPSIVLDWAATPLTGAPNLTNFTVRNLLWDAGLSRWVVLATGPDGAGGWIAVMWAFRADGTYDTTVGNTLATAGSTSTAWAGTRIVGSDNYYLSGIYAASTGFILSNATASMGYWPLNSATAHAMAYDGSNLLVGEIHVVASTPYVQVQRFSSGAVAGGNIVVNPDFEVPANGTTGWTPGSGVSISRTTTAGELISGSGSMAVNVTTSISGLTVTSGHLSVLPRMRHDFSYKLRAMGASHMTVTGSVVFYNSSNVSVASKTLQAPNTDSSVVSVSTTVTTPPTASYAVVSFTFVNVAGRFILDDIVLRTSAGLNYSNLTPYEIEIGAAQSPPVNAMYVGNGDFGAKHWVIASGTGPYAMVASDATKVEDLPVKTFPLPTSNPCGIGYDGSSFYTLDANRILYRHEAGTKTTTAATNWQVANTFAIASSPTTATDETTIGKSLSFPMKRRARLTITGPTILTVGTGDPNASGFYLAEKNGAAGLTDWWRQTYQAGPYQIPTAVLSGATSLHPPSTKVGFPDASPAQWLSGAIDGGGAALIKLVGDGTWRLGPLSGTPAGAVSGITAAMVSGIPQQVPTGTIHMYAVTGAPAGFLACNGSSQLIADYPALSALIRGIYGGVDGTHFYLPNLQGKFPVGTGVGAPAAIGLSGGSKTIDQPNLPNHVHGLAGHQHNLGLEWAANTNTSTGTAIRVTDIDNQTGGSGTNATAVSSGPQGSTDTGNGGFANSDYWQPYTVVNYIIKT